jgi:translocation and assembly module TamB
LSFSAANLDDFSPLALTKMSGGLQAKISASGADQKQAVAIVANSDRMAFGANRIEGLKVDLKIGDLWAARSVTGLARLARAEVAGQSVSDMKLAATGQGDSSVLDLSGSVRGLAVKAQGHVVGGLPIRFDLARFTVQGAGRTIALAGPATLTYGHHGLAIQNFAMRVDSGRLTLSGRADSTLDLRATAVALPRAALDLISPGLYVSGTAEGDVTIRGTSSDPTGDWRIRLRQVSLPQTRSNGLRRSTSRARATSRRVGPRSTSPLTRAVPIPSASPDRRPCRATGRSISGSTAGSMRASLTTSYPSPGAA